MSPALDPRLHPVALVGTHVRLEPLTFAHLAPLSAIAFDPELWRFVPGAVRTPEDLRAYVALALAEQEAGRALPFATTQAADGRVVGSTRLAGIDLRHRRLEIGWTWLAKPWQRSAANTEAKLLLLRHAFGTLGCLRVELKTDARNAVSRAAILRLGAREEGTFRKHMLLDDGTRRDSVWYSILDEEWPAVEARLVERLARG